MKFDNATYDCLKWIANYLLPGITTLWLALGKIWNLPFTTEIGATMAAIDVFMHTVLGISKSNYEGEGEIVLDSNGSVSDFKIQNGRTIQELVDQKSVTVKVNQEG